MLSLASLLALSLHRRERLPVRYRQPQQSIEAQLQQTTMPLERVERHFPQPDGIPSDVRIDRIHVVSINVTPDYKDPNHRKDLNHYLFLMLKNLLNATRAQKLPLGQLYDFLIDRAAPEDDIELVRSWQITNEEETSGFLAPYLLDQLRDNADPEDNVSRFKDLLDYSKINIDGKRRTFQRVERTLGRSLYPVPEGRKSMSWLRRELSDEMWSLHGLYYLLHLQALSINWSNVEISPFTNALDIIRQWVSVHLLCFLRILPSCPLLHRSLFFC